MKVSIAQFFIVSVAYGVALLTAVLQVLFAGLCFSLGLAVYRDWETDRKSVG